ncbi:MAG: TolC family protein [Reichenbachiella sp.]|uniref:TolC family protein n=1 Tax=Reichenbachiella sp. TaxID=2184521 RepID=UPI002966DEFC|nr:TolC family protein [Reichenbachiella sp.]MDW3211426.1 TolC family protein [Reichenbachiella sp.]
MKILTYNNKSILKSILLILILGFAQSISAQGKRPMKLEEVIALVQQHNWDLKKMNQQIGMADSDSRSANAAFLPSVNFTETFTNTTDPMMAFGTKLGQSSIEQADFNPTLLNNPDNISNFNTSINIEQPLFNLDGLYGRKAALKQSEAGQYDKAWMQKMMIIKAKSLYYQLVLTIQAEEVMVHLKSASEANRKVAQDLFDQGAITRADLLGAELRLKQVESEWLRAQHQVVKVNSLLLQHMGEVEVYQIDPIDPIPNIEEANAMLVESNLSEQRADLKAIKLKAEAAGYGYQSQKGSFVPRVNAFGRYSFNDPQFLGTQADNYLVGVQLKWDVFKGGKQIGATQKANYQKQYAQIAYEESRSRADHELQQLKNDFELAIKQKELAELSVDQARALHQIRQDRFAQGLEKTSDLLMDESNYMNQEMQLLKTKHGYLQLMFQLEAATSENSTDESL